MIAAKYRQSFTAFTSHCLCRGMTGRSKIPFFATATFIRISPPSTLRNLKCTSFIRYLTGLASATEGTNGSPDIADETSNLLIELVPSFLADPLRHSSRITERDCLNILSDCCRSRSTVQSAFLVHSPVVKLGIQDAFICNRLLALYARLHGVGWARKLFDELLHRDVVTWTTMISAYVKRGEYEEEALRLFHEMLFKGFVPNDFTLSTVLRCCSQLGEFPLGECVHAWILMFGLDHNPVVGSALMNFYSKWGLMDEVMEVFDMINSTDTVLWTTMISAFVQSGDWLSAWKIYGEMTASGISPCEFTLSNILVSCGSLGLHYGNLIHAHIILWGVQMNLVLKTSLVDMYSRFHEMNDAMKVFNQTPESDVMLWTTIIAGYNQISNSKEAVSIFREMLGVGIFPNAFTYAGIISTCSGVPAPMLGKQIHSHVVKTGLDHDVSVGNALMDMYTKCFSDLDQPLFVFKGIVARNIVSWTTLIMALGLHEKHDEAFSAFMEMRAGGLQPNSFTLSSVLKSCGTAEALINVSKLHSYILKTKFGLLEDEIIGNSLLDAYSRLGQITDACKVLRDMPSRDAITYTSLVKGMNQMGLHDMALGMINSMHKDNVDMDGFSLPCFLSASAGLGSMEPGKQLQGFSVKSGLDSEMSVMNGLIDMYGKCGSSDEAHMVFMSIPKPNVVSWNGLISGLASNGHFSDALSAFEDMRMAGVSPDVITFIVLLYACSHAGLADLGLEYFNSMWKLYGVFPQLDHYVCLVDLLGRAGRFEEAVHTIDTMPFQPDPLIYKTLLGSCKVHRNLVLGEVMARNALSLDPTDSVVYVLLAYMYDNAGKSDYAKQIRTMMKDRGIVKCAGQSWIEIRNNLYLFKAGETSNPWISEIHRKLEYLEAAIGIANVGQDAGKSGSLYHSEKLALAFGLLKTIPTAPIRIIKNLRTCEDCHSFMVLSSKIIGREIIMKDVNRFHIFKNGSCCCGGYW